MFGWPTCQAMIGQKLCSNSLFLRLPLSSDGSGAGAGWVWTIFKAFLAFTCGPLQSPLCMPIVFELAKDIRRAHPLLTSRVLLFLDSSFEKSGYLPLSPVQSITSVRLPELQVSTHASLDCYLLSWLCSIVFHSAPNPISCLYQHVASFLGQPHPG